jgi:diguanylate cyclase (GGDEF)-like protein/PAS domain S-box-containing protein
VTYMNPAAERFLGWNIAELQGRKMHDLTHYKHPDGKPFPIEECAGFQAPHDGKVLKDFDDVFIRKDGSFLPVVYSSAPLVSEGKVAGIVVVFRDVTERKEALELLRVQATRDFLTGLWNRAAILDLLEKELNRSRREETAVSLAFIDLDHFKRINDTYGHQAGDAVLRAVSDKMRAMMRPYDLVGRYGGEEFLIVMPGCDEPNLRKLCERLRGILAETSIEYEKKTISWTVSVGAAMANPAMKTEAELLLRAADLALYRAKTDGRNRVELATV